MSYTNEPQSYPYSTVAELTRDIVESFRGYPIHDMLHNVFSTAQSINDLYGSMSSHSTGPGRTPGPQGTSGPSVTSSLFPSQNEDLSVNPDSDLRNLSDAQILSLTQTIKDEEAGRRPLIAPAVPIAVLRSEYASPTYIAKIDWLAAHGWTGLRRSRGDGDCFYRSMAYAYVERIFNAPDLPLAVASSLSTLERSLIDLKAVGFEPLVYEDFYESLRDVILNIVEPDREGRLLTSATLLRKFQDPEISNSIVVFLRLLTSAYIRMNAEDFVPFLFDPETAEPLEVRRFCEGQVEATGREADHPQVLALSLALRVSIEVAYVDGSAYSAYSNTPDEPGKVDFVLFETEGASGNGTVPITLLYRPGHYDILERKSVEPDE